MSAERKLSPWRGIGLRWLLALFTLLLGVNAVAVWEIVRAGRDAEKEAIEEMRLETEVYARSLEARLASLRGELVLLGQQLLLGSAPAVQDPVAARWRRLEMEAALLLFLEAHGEVERLVLRRATGDVLIAAARRGGAPILTPPQDEPGPEAGAPGLLLGRFPLGRDSELLAAVRSTELLSQVAPGLEAEITLSDGAASGTTAARKGDLLAVRLPVADDLWRPPVRWTLERERLSGRLLASVADLAAGYRTTLMVNLAVIGLTCLLAVLAVQQARRSAALERESEERERIRDLELRLQHSERLAAVGRLAAGLAHEINNPLEGVSNYLELLDEDLRAGRAGQAAGLAAQIRVGVDRVAEVVRRMLTFASPSSRAKSAVDLRHVLRETREFLASNAAYRGVDIDLRLPAETLWVLGDRAALGQLFLNLLLNACEIQERKGRIEIEARRETERVAITVLDHGPGIAAEVLPRIFEPFFSTRGSTGLGLSVCYGVVGDHGGSIAAANQPGAGARFRVELPLCEPPADAAEAEALSASGSHAE